MATEIEKYLAGFKKGTEELNTDMANWSPEELKRHYQDVEAYHTKPFKINDLVGVREDKEFFYYSPVVNSNRPDTFLKLERLRKLGYEVVDSEDSIGQQRGKDPSRMGASSQTRPAGLGDVAVRMRIRKDIKALNDVIKSKIANRQTLYDVNGDPVKISTVASNSVSITEKIEEETIGIK